MLSQNLSTLPKSFKNLRPSTALLLQNGKEVPPPTTHRCHSFHSPPRLTAAFLHQREPNREREERPKPPPKDWRRFQKSPPLFFFRNPSRPQPAAKISTADPPSPSLSPAASPESGVSPPEGTESRKRRKPKVTAATTEIEDAFCLLGCHSTGIDRATIRRLCIQWERLKFIIQANACLRSELMGTETQLKATVCASAPGLKATVSCFELYASEMLSNRVAPRAVALLLLQTAQFLKCSGDGNKQFGSPAVR